MLISEAQNFFRVAAAAGRLAHAYIVVGPPRGAAGDFARFAMRLVSCREPSPPCGHCDACRQIDSRTFPDAFWLSPMKTSRVISVDQMRRGPPERKNPFDPPYFIPWLNETSLRGGWKFGIIEFADRMNGAAANALLKTLEEPPPLTMLLLLTDAPQALLPTISSRCETLALSAPPAELPPEYLNPLLSLLSSIDAAGPFASSAYAQKILAILADMNAAAEAEARAESAETEDDGLAIDKDEEKARVSAIYRQKRSLLVETIQRWLRDLLAVAAGGPDAPIHYRDHADAIRERAARIPLANALANIEAVQNLFAQLEERNLPDSAVFPYWFDRIDFGTPKP
ncbi:MAG: hypothetical protein IJP66_05045 [Kiritimatiellae bacterium]|nr:hypothetical protein [Kiritimatiellia bacterium]